MNFVLNVDLTAQDGCIWQGGKYIFSIEVPNNYPFAPPKCKLQTPIYHPNIDLEGNVCLNILREDWKPVLGVNSVILGLIFLFIEPNPNDPLNHEAAKHMRENPNGFVQQVKKTLKGGHFEGLNFPKMI
tara:strand:- start:27 stop:413 length:387 start_codon:yes stop_codon:yes gene_type:complete